MANILFLTSPGCFSIAAVQASANEKLKLHAAEVKIKSAEERAKESHLGQSPCAHNMLMCVTLILLNDCMSVCVTLVLLNDCVSVCFTLVSC